MLMAAPPACIDADYPCEQLATFIGPERRELAFDLRVRRVAAWTGAAIREELRRTRATRIDVGPRRDALGEPCARELVFDLDADDFAAMRHKLCSCGPRVVCDVCWPLMVWSARLLETLLDAHFGIAPGRWFFSGGRGLHGWFRSFSRLEHAVLGRWLAQLAARFGPERVAQQPAAVAFFNEHRAALTAVNSFVTVHDLALCIDMKVTSSMTHLLKAPWLHHPQTGWQAVEIRLVDHCGPGLPPHIGRHPPPMPP